jgi:hypothetical protein
LSVSNYDGQISFLLKNKYNFPMKKIFLFSILSLVLASCGDDVEFNSPSFEAKKDGVLWRAVDSKATLNPNGSMTIQAFNSKEVVTLTTISSAPQTYPLATSAENSATYVFSDANTKLTYNSEDKDVSAASEIVIEQYDAQNKTVTGTFIFNIKNTDEKSTEPATMSYQYGKFYKVPVTVAK